MKAISCLSQLQEYGFNLLTGEACKLSERVLVDLNEQAVKTVCEYFSIRREGLRENWNSGSVASIMLGYEDWKGLALFAMYLSGEFSYVIKTSKGVYGLSKEERIWYSEVSECYFVHLETGLDRPWFSDLEGRVQRIIKCDSAQTRNQHQMTGRVV